MFSSLAEATAHNLTLAGPDFSWSNTGGTSRPRADAMRGLRVLLWEAAGGVCAACGDSVAISDGEVAHVVSNHGSASKGRGYTAGCLYFSHTTCNADDWEVYGPVIPVNGFVRPELVPLNYWTRREMLAAAESFAARVSNSEAQARAARLARRLALRDQSADEGIRAYA